MVNNKKYWKTIGLEIKSDETPAVIERIVNDLDMIVRVVRFDGWQSTGTGEREVQKSLRKTLLKYQLHLDQELFEKAYLYIKEYCSVPSHLFICIFKLPS